VRNFYLFTEAIVKPSCIIADAVQEVDIGGVTLLRAAAKNYERVSILSNPTDYKTFPGAWKDGKGDVGQGLRASLALKAFEMTARHNEAISAYFSDNTLALSCQLGIGRASTEDRIEAQCKPASEARAGLRLRGRASVPSWVVFHSSDCGKNGPIQHC